MKLNTHRHLDVLDYGLVRLIDWMGDDLSIIRAARVSHNAEWRAGNDDGSDRRLIKYMLANGHTSPFEHVTFTFEVKAPIFVFRQWHRHRTWSFNEISGRYSELPEQFYVPNVAYIGVQSKDNKQARKIEDLPAEVIKAREGEIGSYTNICQMAFEEYRDLLAKGWPRELARMVLPLSTYSRMVATIDLHNLLRFIELRDHAHAQWEIQVYAKAMLKLIDPVVPVTLDVWKELRA